MSSSRWYQWLRRSAGFSSPSGRVRLRPRARASLTSARRSLRPRLEALEDRLVPSGYDFGKIDDPQAAAGPPLYLPLQGTIPYGINDSLNIVGQYTDANGALHGFLFSKGNFTTLDDPQAGTGLNQGTSASGISPSGQIVGTYWESNNAAHGFLLVNGQYTTLDDPNGVGSTLANAINASGQIVGYYQDASGYYHGFLLSGGQYTTLDDPNAVLGTFASGINASGQIVGSYLDLYGVYRGFLLVNGQYTNFDEPNAVGGPGSPGTLANGINDSGQIVGGYTDATTSFQGFILSGGQYTTIDNPNNPSPTTYGTPVQGINNTGQIVGFYTDSNYFSHGYAANPVNHGPVAPASPIAGSAAMGGSGAAAEQMAVHPVGGALPAALFGNVLVVSPPAPLLNAQTTGSASRSEPAAPTRLVAPGLGSIAVPQGQAASTFKATVSADATTKVLDQLFASFRPPLASALSDASITGA